MAALQTPPTSRRIPAHEIRFRLVAVAVIVAVVAAVAAYLTLSGREKRDVAVPPASATPRQVVAAYLDALDARDCRTAEALWPGRGGCGQISGVDDITIDARPVAGDQVLVDTSFDLHKRLFVGDAALDAGPTTSAFTLERNAAGALRIAGSAGPG